MFTSSLVGPKNAPIGCSRYAATPGDGTSRLSPIPASASPPISDAGPLPSCTPTPWIPNRYSSRWLCTLDSPCDARCFSGSSGSFRIVCAPSACATAGAMFPIPRQCDGRLHASSGDTTFASTPCAPLHRLDAAPEPTHADNRLHARSPTGGSAVHPPSDRENCCEENPQ